MITNEGVELQTELRDGEAKEGLYLGLIEKIRDLIRSNHYRPGKILLSEGDQVGSMSRSMSAKSRGSA